MKHIFYLISCMAWISFHAQVKPGTYMSFGNGSNFHLSQTGESILIEPCQKFESQLTINNNTYQFKKLANTEKFGWEGGSDVILNVSDDQSAITFKYPINMREERSFKFMHTPGTLPASGVKTYFDETIGGYSKARILITDPGKIKTGNCFIHSIAKDEMNSYLVGNYKGLFDANWKATFNADYSGSFLGLPMSWTIVSDEKGNIIKWDIPNSKSVVFFVMVEFKGELPKNMDPVSTDKTVAGIYSAVYDGQTNTIEINQMVKN